LLRESPQEVLGLLFEEPCGLGSLRAKIKVDGNSENCTHKAANIGPDDNWTFFGMVCFDEGALYRKTQRMKVLEAQYCKRL
jgi:hypothetical protein